MRLFVCTDHDGHYPVGVCSVIVANDEFEADSLLRAALKDHGLNPDKPRFHLQERSLTEPRAFVENDGDY